MTRKLTLGQSAADIEPEPVKWAWELAAEGRLPAGTLSIAAGREGTGKSTVATWLAAQITRGTLRGAWEGHPKRVVYLTREDSWKHTIVPRLIAAGADLSRVHQVDVIEEGSDYGTLSLPKDTKDFGRLIKKNHVGLAVLDPLLSMIDVKHDAHSNQQIRQALEPLVAVAEETECLMFGLAHFLKGDAADAASAILGASAFKDLARTVFAFANDPLIPGTHVLSQVKNSLGRLDLPSLAYETRGRTIPTKKGPASTSYVHFTGYALRSVDDIRSKNRTQEVDEFLLSYLHDFGPSVLRTDVVAAGSEAGYSESSLKRAARRLGIDKERSGFQGGSTWSIGMDTRSDPNGLNDLNELNGLSGPNGDSGGGSGRSGPPGPFGPLGSPSPRARAGERARRHVMDFTRWEEVADYGSVVPIKKNA